MLLFFLIIFSTCAIFVFILTADSARPFTVDSDGDTSGFWLCDKRASNHHLLQCVGPRDFCWAVTVRTSDGSRRRPSEPENQSVDRTAGYSDFSKYEINKHSKKLVLISKCW